MNIINYDFIQNAICAGLLASIACGIIGPFILAKRMVLIADGLTHIAFGGLGIAYWLGINPFYGAIFFIIITSICLGFFEEKIKYHNDLLIGILWSIGMSIGIIFISFTEDGFVPDLMSFLFGNILLVPQSNIIIMFLLVLILIIIMMFFYKGFIAITIDKEFAISRGLPVKILNIGMLLLIAISIITLIQVVGIILVIALLTIPVGVSNIIEIKNFKLIILISILIGSLMSLGGLWVSYYFELPSGATIILVGIGILFLIKIIKVIIKKIFYLLFFNNLKKSKKLD